MNIIFYSPPIILREGKVDDVVVLTFSLGAAFVVNGGAAVSNRSAHYSIRQTFIHPRKAGKSRSSFTHTQWNRKQIQIWQ